MNSRLRFPLVLAFATLYNYLFWLESLGLNFILFSVLISLAMIWLNPNALKSQGVWISLGCVGLTGFAVLYHHSAISQFSHACSIFLLAGFVSQPQLRTVYHAVAAYWANFWNGWRAIKNEFQFITKEHNSLQKAWNYLKLSVIPVAGLLTFYLLYSMANPKFAQLGEALFTQLSTWFDSLSIDRFLFFMLGFVISLSMIFQMAAPKWLSREQKLSDKLMRRRQRQSGNFNLIGLKKEYRIAAMLFGMLNALLIVNNCIDIHWVWFNFEVHSITSLKQFVHEGTYTLIFSILLAMALVLYYFRGNLNFFSGNAVLKRLAYAWIFQNAVLVISVGLRNYHYISYHGLAYKRIGVIFFLLLTLFGLFTLFIKIRDQKSTFFLLRTNSWAVLGIMMWLSLVNWDTYIAKYNLTKSYPAEVDTSFLLSLSDKALPILMDNSAIFYQHGYQERLENRVKWFKRDYERRSWRSWNWAEMRAYKKLND